MSEEPEPQDFNELDGDWVETSEAAENNFENEEEDFEEEQDYYKRPNGTSARCPFSKQVDDITKFHILDETDEKYDSEDENDDYDSDIPDDEIEKMLEEALESKKRNASEAGLDSKFDEKQKTVLVEKNQHHFEVLPEGWLTVTHNSGMPIYLHKTTRVITLTRPYFLGPGSARKHLIPISSIPCLSYKKALEKADETPTEEEKLEKSSIPSSFPEPKIETINDSKKNHNLTPEAFREYCEKVFQFQTIKVLRFKSWSERRKHTKKRKIDNQLQRPALPDGTKLISFPIRGDPDVVEKTNPNTRREWIMNPNGKSYICILHEYVQHALKKQPNYEFTELENAATPYMATVIIKEMKYGVGYGTSKKQAKSEAAKATLEILIPQMKEQISSDNQTGCAKKEKNQDLSFFDVIRVEDPRVAEFCAKTTEPAPYDVLLTCLQRNFGLDDLKINYQGKSHRSQGNEFTMTVGKYTATVQCKNKRDGKQRASQSILQALHPGITTWGSLLRLYGNHSVKSFKEKKMEEQEITSLQSKAAVNQPNYAILEKLRLELGKLEEKRQSIRPLGVLNTADTEMDFRPPSTSKKDLNKKNKLTKVSTKGLDKKYVSPKGNNPLPGPGALNNVVEEVLNKEKLINIVDNKIIQEKQVQTLPSPDSVVSSTSKHDFAKEELISNFEADISSSTNF